MHFCKAFLFFILLGALSMSLAACGPAKRIFGEDEKPPLEGERLSVLQYQDGLEPDPVLASSQMELPESWRNSFWPQSGGYPSHAMGHLGLDMPLTRKWSASVGTAGHRRRPILARPVIADGKVFTLDAAARLSAFDAESGKRLWQRSITPKNETETGTVGGGIAFSEGRLFAGAGYMQIAAYNPETGETLWTQNTAAPIRSAPAVGSGRVFVITLDNKIQAFNAENGEFLWDYSGVLETTNLLGSSAPAVYRNIVVAALSSGEVLALRTENGQVLWQDNLASLRRHGALPGISDIRGLPVIDRGIIYVIGASGRMVALDENSGRRIWQQEIGGTETPWPVGDTVFVLTDDRQLVALSRHNGRIHWVERLDDLLDRIDPKDPPVWTGPVFGGERLILASNQGHVLELDPYSGSVKNSWTLRSGTVIPPVIADGRLYILGQDAQLSAFGGK